MPKEYVHQPTLAMRWVAYGAERLTDKEAAKVTEVNQGTGKRLEGDPDSQLYRVFIGWEANRFPSPISIDNGMIWVDGIWDSCPPMDVIRATIEAQTDQVKEGVYEKHPDLRPEAKDKGSEGV